MKEIICVLVGFFCFLGFSAEVFAADTQIIFKDKESSVLLGNDSGKNVLLEDSDRNILLSGSGKKHTSRIKIFPKICLDEIFMEEIWTLDHFQGEVVLIKIPPQQILVEVDCSRE